MFIDLSRIKRDQNDIQIPINVVRHYRDMDKVYRLKDEIKDGKAWLVLSKESWKIIQEA